jgi:hypothetical protein
MRVSLTHGLADSTESHVLDSVLIFVQGKRPRLMERKRFDGRLEEIMEESGRLLCS